MHNKELNKGVCLTADCGKPAYCKNLCKTCYGRLYAAKNYNKVADSPEKQCKFEACDKQRHARGYCSNHYAQLIQKGKLTPSTSGICKIPGCKTQVYAKDYCHPHYKSNIEQNHTLASRYKQVIRRAIDKGLGYDITKEFYAEFIKSPCFYCGSPLAKTGSGIDRADNSLGYLMSNSIPCCPSCNTFKGKFLTKDEMLEVIKLIKKLRNRQAIWE